MHVVLINGPAGAGKNTLANDIRNMLRSQFNAEARLRKLLKQRVSNILIAEHKQPLIHMLFAFAASLSVIELFYDVENEEAYRRLKETVMLGRTGRQWQIIWADAMRASDSNVFIDGLHAKTKSINPDIAIIPDCGFEDEYTRAVNRFGAANVSMIYLDGDWKVGVPIYRHLDRFNDDIRVCLRDHANLINPDALTAAHYILGRIEENAKQTAFEF